MNLRDASKIQVLETEDIGFDAGIFLQIFPSLTSVSKADVMLFLTASRRSIMKSKSEFLGTEAYERQPVR